MRDIIEKNKINEKYILNFDETPCFWEYAPKKIEYLTCQVFNGCKLPKLLKALLNLPLIWIDKSHVILSHLMK